MECGGGERLTYIQHDYRAGVGVLAVATRHPTFFPFLFPTCPHNCPFPGGIQGAHQQHPHTHATGGTTPSERPFFSATPLSCLPQRSACCRFRPSRRCVLCPLWFLACWGGLFVVWTVFYLGGPFRRAIRQQRPLALAPPAKHTQTQCFFFTSFLLGVYGWEWRARNTYTRLPRPAAARWGGGGGRGQQRGRGRVFCFFSLGSFRTARTFFFRLPLVATEKQTKIRPIFWHAPNVRDRARGGQPVGRARVGAQAKAERRASLLFHSLLSLLCSQVSAKPRPKASWCCHTCSVRAPN